MVVKINTHTMKRDLEIMRVYLIKTSLEMGYNKGETAIMFNISRPTLYKIIREFDVKLDKKE